jgi:hypothetical protein
MIITCFIFAKLGKTFAKERKSLFSAALILREAINAQTARFADL